MALDSLSLCVEIWQNSQSESNADQDVPKLNLADEQNMKKMLDGDLPWFLQDKQPTTQVSGSFVTHSLKLPPSALTNSPCKDDRTPFGDPSPQKSFNSSDSISPQKLEHMSDKSVLATNSLPPMASFSDFFGDSSDEQLPEESDAIPSPNAPPPLISISQSHHASRLDLATPPPDVRLHTGSLSSGPQHHLVHTPKHFTPTGDISAQTFMDNVAVCSDVSYANGGYYANSKDTTIPHLVVPMASDPADFHYNPQYPTQSHSKSTPKKNPDDEALRELFLQGEAAMRETCHADFSVDNGDLRYSIDDSASPASSTDTYAPTSPQTQLQIKSESYNGIHNGYQYPPPMHSSVAPMYLMQPKEEEGQASACYIGAAMSSANTPSTIPTAPYQVISLTSGSEESHSPIKVSNMPKNSMPNDNYLMSVDGWETPAVPPPSYHEAVNELNKSGASPSQNNAAQKTADSQQNMVQMPMALHPPNIYSRYYSPVVYDHGQALESYGKQLYYNGTASADMAYCSQDPFYYDQKGLFCQIPKKKTIGRPFGSGVGKKKKRSFYEVDPSTRPYGCEWANCGKTFKERKHLVVHMRIHNDERPLNCAFCEYQCRQRTSLNWHVKKKHPESLQDYEQHRQKCKGRPKQ